MEHAQYKFQIIIKIIRLLLLLNPQGTLDQEYQDGRASSFKVFAADNNECAIQLYRDQCAGRTGNHL